jgi:hypothetical protein
MTPHLRTAWEVEHILGKDELQMAQQYFNKVEIKYFNLATLIAVPFRRMRGFSTLLTFLGAIDSVILKCPLLKWMAWQVVFILSQPKKSI